MSVNTRLHETGTLDEKKTCPYNTSHVMTGYRFQAHLIKCRKQNPEKAKLITVCPYNQIHHVFSTDINEHLQICPQYLHFQRTVVARKVNTIRQGTNGGTSSNGELKPKDADELCLSGISKTIQRPFTPEPPPTEDELDEWQ